MFPTIRPRRLRSSHNLRRLMKNVHLSIDNFVMPLFVREGHKIKKPVGSMPGIYQLSVDNMLKEAEEISKLNIPAVLLFGIPEKKDEKAGQAYAQDGIIQKATAQLKKNFPQLVVITDTCLCEYTSSGHCGVIKKGKFRKELTVDNDRSLELLAKTALSQAQAGADIVAPSAMMDGQVKAIREILDKNGFSDTAIMAYSAKYASYFYGPFRDAAESAPKKGDRKTYQMDFSTSAKEALKETVLDIAEGADIVMVKPALSYLDIIREVKRNINTPLAAYNVSGEYSLLKAAAQKGWIDEKGVVFEILTAIKRAGADIIISYYTKEVANWLK